MDFRLEGVRDGPLFCDRKEVEESKDCIQEVGDVRGDRDRKRADHKLVRVFANR
jgi:hypothetical protein